MDILLRTQEVSLPDNGSGVLARRLDQMLARAAARIKRLHVTLKDINGPRGGRDKVCTLRAELSDGGQIIVSDRSADLGRAIARSARRLKASFGREIARRRVRRRQRPAPEYAVVE